MPTRRLLALLCVSLGAAALAAEDRPPAPAGFTWKDLDAIHASFLLPNGWHFKEEKDGATLAYFFSEEDIAETGEFKTGLTLTVFRFDDGKAQERAVAAVARIAQTEGNEALEAKDFEMGVLKGMGARIRHTEKAHPPLMMAVLAIGNSRTNALYLMIFESPESTWKEAWEKGEKMLSGFVLDKAY